MEHNNPISASLQDAYAAISHALDVLDAAENAGLKIHPSVSNRVNTAKLTLAEAMKDLSVSIDLNTCVRDYYLCAYPKDDLGPRLLSDVTFQDVVNGLNKGQGFYETVGPTVDTIVRERIFSKVAELLDVDYLAVYRKWLYPEENPALTVSVTKEAAPKRTLADQIQAASKTAAANTSFSPGKETDREF